MGTGAEADSLGNVRHESGDHAASIPWQLEAVALFRDLGDRYGEALCLTNLGNTYSALGDQDPAIGFADQSIEAFRSRATIAPIATRPGGTRSPG